MITWDGNTDKLRTVRDLRELDFAIQSTEQPSPRDMMLSVIFGFMLSLPFWVMIALIALGGDK